MISNFVKYTVSFNLKKTETNTIIEENNNKVAETEDSQEVDTQKLDTQEDGLLMIHEEPKVEQKLTKGNN